jgi:phosphohistidine swiveling domain-containing protein
MRPLDACVGLGDAGGKAETLARARAAGLRVADGTVLLPDDALDDAELAGELTRLGGQRFVVRSSASLEDRPGATAAGVFVSVVAEVAEVARAVAAVRASADGPALRAYLAARGFDERARMAVLIQPWVAAERYGVAHSAGAHFRLESRAAGEPEWGDVRPSIVARDDAGELATGLRALERLVGGPVDAELASSRSGEQITWLQARPLNAPRAQPSDAPTLPEPGRWTRDAEHNPDPLSPAQASLVAFVDGLGVGSRQLVVGGQLYVERGAPARGRRPIAFGQLRRRFDSEIVPDCRAALAAANATPVSLDAALAAFAHVYRRYVGELSPSLSQARAELDRLLRTSTGEPLTAHAALLGGLGGATLARDQLLWQLGRGQATLADYLARYGDHAPAWDVATATDRERPDRVRQLATLVAASPSSPAERQAQARALAEAAADALADRLDRSARQELRSLLPRVREVLPIAEDDDLLFLAAQATVRRAILARAATLPLATLDDAFWLTLAELRAPPPELSALVANRRAETAAQRRAIPPAAYEDGVPEWTAPPSRTVLRGAATAGRARGHAVVIRALADAPTTLPPDAILVAPALVPSLAPLLPLARALVTDHGGALSHAATLAREYGIPAVLGTGAATAIPDGAELYVDGDAGRVYVLDDVG